MITELIAQIDNEINRLNKAKAALQSTTLPISAPTTTKRVLSEAARRKIGQAQRKRWKKHHEQMAAQKAGV